MHYFERAARAMPESCRRSAAGQHCQARRLRAAGGLALSEPAGLVSPYAAACPRIADMAANAVRDRAGQAAAQPRYSGDIRLPVSGGSGFG